MLPVHPYLKLFLTSEEYQYLFRRALVGFQPLSMVVNVKNINIKGVNVVARKAAKETDNERLCSGGAGFQLIRNDSLGWFWGVSD